ncbi:hypothetical protein GCM10009718_36960 [Isoptericola halotolerans]|uniref:DUF5047 domain-containing protein n=1 Tax=Isoptericola halotolerans TaxID=300560 RepID=A0ABX2A6F0_9MICO|nr:DUF5047 domain-containing protein [Isoptericola halotolerans]NOV98226.1 hypothetical protein [Isoptericola halotolerans]
MWPVPEAYDDVVRSSNGLSVTVDVFKAGVRLYSGLPVVGGSITVDATSATRRTCSLTLPPFLPTGAYSQAPALPDPLDGAPRLATRGHELRVRHSLITSDGTPLTIPVGRFRVDDLSGSALGRTEVTLGGVSREAHVADDVFISPRTVQGPSAAALIGQLIRESLPQAVVINVASHDAPVREMTEGSDRWGLILTLATSIAAQVYADPLGQFVIADSPTVDTEPVWTFAPGGRYSPGGGRTLVDAQRAESRADVVNRVAVQGSTPDGAPDPIVGVAIDDDPTSPTRWGDPDAGAWGRASVVISQPNLTSLAQCRTVARAELAKRTGAAAGLDLSAVPHAALEARDVVDVVVPTSASGYSHTVRRHVIDRFTLPLTAGGDFPVTTRDLRAVTA